MAAISCGATVRVKLKGGETVEGTVFSSDSTMLALEQGLGPDGKATYRIVNQEAVEEQTVLMPVLTSSMNKVPLPAIDDGMLIEREKQAIQKSIDDAAYIGEGVTAHAQAIFDALRKTMPCEWKAQEIVVLNEVPHLPQTAHAPPARPTPRWPRAGDDLAAVHARPVQGRGHRAAARAEGALKHFGHSRALHNTLYFVALRSPADTFR